MTATAGKILYDDVSDDVVFSGPAWTLPLTNMQDPRPTKVARSADATAAKTQFFMTFDSIASLPGIIFVGTNLTVNAQWRITAYSDSLFAVQIYTSGLQNAWLSTKSFIDPDFKGMKLIALFGEIVTALYWQVELFDSANPDGHVDLGTMFAGKELSPTFNFVEGSSFSRDPNTTVQTALARTPYFSRHKNIRTADLHFPFQDYAVAWDEFDVMFEKSGLDRPIFVILFPDDLDRRDRQSFLARFAKISDLQMLASARASTGVQVIEYAG